jgi:hypothetical protein
MDNPVNVAHYISELLFRHDCVVVPGFGGFVSTYAPARIHPARHTFLPPGKQIVFNKHLQQNDGLLAQAIATETPCSFDEAMEGIRVFVDAVTVQLKEGKKSELHNLGTLSLDPEGNTSFESYPEINYLVDSFGLGSFQSMPILRETSAEKRKPVERVDRAAEEKIPDTKTVPVRSRTRRAVVAAAITIPFLVAAVWFGAKNQNGLAGLGIFGKKEPTKYHFTERFKAGEKVMLATELKPDSNGIAQFTLAENAPPIIVDIHKVMPDSTMVARRQGKSIYVSQRVVSTTRYFIVGGCFGVPENAERFTRQLRDKGYDPVVVEQYKSKLTHIGLASFSTKAEAEQFLTKVRNDIPNAWILKK